MKLRKTINQIKKEKMKRIMKMALVALMAMGMSQASYAQLSKLEKLGGGLLTSKTASNVVGDVVGNLLGTNKLNEKNLTGTWNYSGPCVVLESKNVLANVGGTVITGQIEDKLGNTLKKIGFKPGTVLLTLDVDKTFSVAVGGKPVQGTWSVEGTNLVLTILGKSIKINANLSGGNLQLAMNADKMLTLLNAVTTQVSTLSSSFGTLTNLLKKYDGVHLGLKFAK